MLLNEAIQLNEELVLKDETKEAPLIVTNCKTCVFSKWNNTDEWEHKQEGCELNRLEKFQDKEWINDENVEYWRINRVCNTWRSNEWLDLQDENQCHVETILKEVELKCGAIVRQGDENLDNISLTLKDLVNQSLKPASVTLIVENHHIPIDQIYKMMQNVFVGSDISWNFERIFDTSLTDYKIWDKGISRAKGQYFMLCEGGKRVSKEAMNRINELLNYDLKRFLVIGSEIIHQTVIQQKLWKVVGGFGTKGLLEKIQILEDEQNTNMILKWEDVWQ